MIILWIAFDVYLFELTQIIKKKKQTSRTTAKRNLHLLKLKWNFLMDLRRNDNNFINLHIMWIFTHKTEYWNCQKLFLNSAKWFCFVCTEFERNTCYSMNGIFILKMLINNIISKLNLQLILLFKWIQLSNFIYLYISWNHSFMCNIFSNPMSESDSRNVFFIFS